MPQLAFFAQCVSTQMELLVCPAAMDVSLAVLRHYARNVWISSGSMEPRIAYSVYPI